MNSPIIYTDKELVEGLACNNNAVITEIYRLYQPMLKKWMITRGGSETDAYDVFQEGLVVLYEKANDESFILTSKLSTYLFAICKRIWFKKSQQSAYFNSIDDNKDSEDDSDDYLGSYDEDVNSHFEKEAQFDKLEKAMEALGNPCSGLLKAFYIEEKSMQEIATAFGYTNAENAKTQKYKCLTRLKKIFFDSKNAFKL